MEFIIQMKDGGLVNIESESWSSDGCETCDFGSEYINDLTLYLTNERVDITINKMYDYFLNTGEVILLFTKNYLEIQKMTEQEFINWLREFFKEKEKEGGIEEFEMRINFI